MATGQEVILAYHEELGGFREEAYRRITREVMWRVQKRLEKGNWMVADEQEKAALAS